MTTDGTETAGAGTYERFENRVERIRNVGNAAGILRWDQEVVMPEAGTPARAKQLSTLSSIGHELLTAEETGALLEALEGADLEDGKRAVVRELRREYDRATSVPQQLVEEISETTSNAHPRWKAARAEDDFETFAPTLEKLVGLKREYADHVDPDADPYAVLFAEYEPYIDLEAAATILAELREELVPLIEAISESEADLETDAFSGEFDADTQEAVCRDVLDELGYDWDRGRLDTAPHPFSSGTQFDARVTTRFDESDLWDLSPRRSTSSATPTTPSACPTRGTGRHSGRPGTSRSTNRSRGSGRTTSAARGPFGSDSCRRSTIGSPRPRASHPETPTSRQTRSTRTTSFAWRQTNSPTTSTS